MSWTALLLFALAVVLFILLLPIWALVVYFEKPDER